MNKRYEYWWQSSLGDGARQCLHTMENLEKSFCYTQRMVNAADEINYHRRYKVKVIRSFLTFTWVENVEVSGQGLYYLLRQDDNISFDDYWLMVTEGWVDKEWAEFVKFNSEWEGQDE